MPRKGFDTAIRAFARLRRSRPDLVLAISGGGRDEERLKRLATELDAPVRFLVTLNYRAAIDPSCILRSFQYTHPVYTPAGVAAQSRHRELNGAQRTYFCGAYWRSGFHEDGVVSAQTALAHFAEDLERAQLPLPRVG